jgi:predicted Kef-type K+ transport protein
MVCIDGSTLFLKVVFLCSFVLIFGALCWRCFENDLLGFLVGVTYEVLVPLWLVTLPPNLSRIGLVLVVFRVGRVLNLERRFRRFLLIVSVSGRFL